MKAILFGSFALALLVVIGLASRPDSEPVDEYAMRGVVRAVLNPGELVIEHEEIPGFMPAMTMAFELEQALPPEAVAVNDTVSGLLQVSEEGMRLRDLQITSKGTPPANLAGEKRPGSSVTRLDEGDRVPAFAMVDQHGKSRTLATPGHYTALTFIFTRCPVPDFCPLMSQRFTEIQRAIGEDRVPAPLELVSLTIDPEFDTPELMAAYGAAHRADPKVWSLTRATPEETDRVVRAFRVYREKNGALLDHTLCTALIDPNGRIVQIWRGNEWQSDEVLAALEQDASARPALALGNAPAPAR